MNIRKTIIMALLLVISTMNAMAQHRIDDMMDNYSSRGTSRYTSAVERDPRTRKVLKVVNVLELNHIGISEFINAFRQDSKNGNFTEKYTEDELTLMLTVRGERQNRIYMMNCSGAYNRMQRNTRYSKAKITVIIKYE